MSTDISEENKAKIKSSDFSTRLRGCRSALKEHQIQNEIEKRRRIYPLICSNDPFSTTEKERSNFEKAIDLLEKYIQNYAKPIDFFSLSTIELDELFLDECWDYQGLTVDKVNLFLKNGADLNCQDSKNYKPFHYASASDDIKVNMVFLARGAGVNERFPDRDPQTIWTENHSNVYEKVKLYLDHGAEINAKGKYGDTVLNKLCSTCRDIKCIELLVERGADLNIRNNTDASPLISSINCDSEAIVQLFTSKGVDVNQIGVDGSTPLIYATKNGKQSFVDFLLKHGANKDLKDFDGKIAYDYAVSSGFLEIAKILNPEKAVSDFSENGEVAVQIRELKKSIIQKFKDGCSYGTYDQEGESKLWYEKSVFIQDYHGHLTQNCSRVVFETEEKLLDYLFKLFSPRSPNSQVGAYEKILNMIL
jgi:ankyrin repeat protein